MVRLAVCFDGTWNTPDKGAKSTNVVNMVRAIRNRDDDGVRQITFYDKGVGTAGGTDAITGGGFGAGLTANVMDGYRFIANNHLPDDEIYIFGFSRGAYTARCLAGIISLAGLLQPQNLGRDFKAVMDIYQRKNISSDRKRQEIARLGLAPARRSRIRCVGVWDTVGSLGIPGDFGRHLLEGKWFSKAGHDFNDVELGPNVDIALHAIAIDEKRGAFPPTLWMSNDGQPASGNNRVEQVWFAGSHSNVGGSYDDSGLSDIAFDWLARRVAALTGLAMDTSSNPPVEAAHAAATGIDSRTWLYTDARAYPYQRIVNRETPAGDGIGSWFRSKFPALDRRNISPGGLRPINEALHISALERWHLPAVPHDCKTGAQCVHTSYRPVNLAAVIHAHHEGRTVPVIGWDGNVMKRSDVRWPNLETIN